MKPVDRTRLLDLDAYIKADPVNRRHDHKSRTVMRLAQTLEEPTGRLVATDYALAGGVPAHVVKRVLHDLATRAA